MRLICPPPSPFPPALQGAFYKIGGMMGGGPKVPDVAYARTGALLASLDLAK